MIKVQTLRAANPGAFTGAGTNTYLVGEDDPVLVDPGPARPDHLAAILQALAGRRLAAIIVTHAHLDHSALAPALAHATGAEVLAFGTADSGQSPLMRQLAAEGLMGGEGVDHAFTPDRCLTDGQILTLAGTRIEVLHTPGHMAGHISLAVASGAGEVLLSGDHVMGWSTSLVSPPEGDMAAYMASLARLAARDWRHFLPGHGAPVDDPAARLAELAAHRRMREAAVLAQLAQGPATAEALAAAIYTTTPAALLPAAARNVLAHLIDLATRGLVLPLAAAPGLPYASRAFALCHPN